MKASLEKLFVHCTVKISVAGGGMGTGFFVAPGLILTCAHVVAAAQRHNASIDVRWNDQSYTAQLKQFLLDQNVINGTLVAIEPYYPDLALLQVECTEHPCIYLRDEIHVGDGLYSYGYTGDYSHGDSATFEYEGEGINDVQQPLLKFKAGQVVGGLSGAPLLNLKTGHVCGVIQMSRDSYSDAGGRAIPLSTVFGVLPELETQQKQFHHQDSRWLDCLDQWQREQHILERVSPIWGVPYRRHPFFIGREDILQQLHASLRGGNAVAMTQRQGATQAISGLGGIGKTQTAVEYAYRYKNEYDVVLWARAGSKDTLISDFVSMARSLQLPEKEAADQNITVNAVKRWLESHTRWLLVLDNADEPTLVYDFLPSTDQGHIMLTTRAQAVTGIAQQRIDVDRMEPELGALLLLRRANLLAVSAKLDDASPSDRAAALDISRALDGIPLALDQAGAFIEETASSLSEYLQLYQTQHAELLRVRGQMDFYHPEPVTTTWLLSFGKVRLANPAAADLLQLCAFLHPDAIPEEIIVRGQPALDGALQPVAGNPFQWEMAIRELLRYSLVRRNAKLKVLSVHRLVQAILKDEMQEAARRSTAEHVVKIVNRAFPDAVDFSVWSQCDMCLPHVQVCVAYITRWHFTFPEAARLLDLAGFYLQERAQYKEAEPLLLLALDIRKQTLGSEHPDMAHSLHHLAVLDDRRGRFAKAESLYKQALAIREKMLDPMHPDVARTLHYLAMLYGKQSRYAEAEPLFERALEIRKQVLGLEHSDTAHTIRNLAVLYERQGKNAEAAPLLQQSMEINQKVLGLEHPQTARSLNTLASVYRGQHKYQDAERLARQAVAIQEKTLGAEHPDVAESLDTLRDIYTEQGNYDQAKPFAERAVAIYDKTLEPEHPYHIESLTNLADIYQAQGNNAPAKQLFQRVLAILEKTPDGESLAMVNSLDGLAGLYYAQGEYAESEALYKRALAIRERELGAENFDVANNLYSLAAAYWAQGRFAEAVALGEHALTIYEQTLEPEHIAIANALNLLGVCYYDEGCYAGVESLYQRVLVICEKNLGPEHPEVARVLSNMAELYRTLGRNTEVEPLCQRSLAMYEQTLGPKHPDLAGTLNVLAVFYFTLGRYSQAEPFCQRAVQVLQETRGPEHPELATALAVLAELHYLQGRYMEAEQDCQQALTIQKKALAEDHPNAARSLHVLAQVYQAQNRCTEAEQVCRQALVDRRKRLGEDHLDTMRSLNVLALIYKGEGRYLEAEPLIQQALAGFERVLGPECLDIAITLENYADLLKRVQRDEEALEVYLRAKTIRAKLPVS